MLLQIKAKNDIIVKKYKSERKFIMKTYKDGWYTVAGYEVYVENNKVVKGVKKSCSGVGEVPAYPYVAAKDGGWNLASRELSLEAFRARVKRGTADLK